MLFNNVSKSTKLEILEENIPKYEKDIYELLIQLGIDPVLFDEDTFEEEDPLANPDDTITKALRSRLKKAADAVILIKQEIANLEI